MMRWLRPQFWKNMWNLRKVANQLEVDRAKKIKRMDELWDKMEKKTDKSTMFVFKTMADQMETMQHMVQQTKDVEETLKKTMEIVQYEFEQKLEQSFPTTDKFLDALAKQNVHPMHLVAKMQFRKGQQTLDLSKRDPEELQKEQELTMSILRQTLSNEENAALGKLMAESAAKPIQATTEKISEMTDDLSELRANAEKQRKDRDEHLRELRNNRNVAVSGISNIVDNEQQQQQQQDDVLNNVENKNSNKHN